MRARAFVARRLGQHMDECWCTEMRARAFVARRLRHILFCPHVFTCPLFKVPRTLAAKKNERKNGGGKRRRKSFRIRFTAEAPTTLQRTGVPPFHCAQAPLHHMLPAVPRPCMSLSV